jgi:hypothetical protein
VKVEYYGATTFSPVLFDINESVNSMFRKSGMHHMFWVGDSNGKSTYLAPWTHDYHVLNQPTGTVLITVLGAAKPDSSPQSYKRDAIGS